MQLPESHKRTTSSLPPVEEPEIERSYSKKKVQFSVEMEGVQVPPPAVLYQPPQGTQASQPQGGKFNQAAGQPGPNIANQADDGSLGFCGTLLVFFSWILVLALFPLCICQIIRKVEEYERAVIFRLGRLLPGGPKGPGVFLVNPCVDNFRKIDLRTISFDIPPQEILSKDSVTVHVDGVVYYRIANPTYSIANVANVNRATHLLAQTTLRNVLGTKLLSEILSDRESIAHLMQTSLDEATDQWGVKVERVEIKNVILPQQLQRAMAAEAEATREAKAKLIAAEGEQKASVALREAADVINQSPAALQLRYLQTLNTIAAEKNSTIIFPLPIELMRGIAKN